MPAQKDLTDEASRTAQGLGSLQRMVHSLLTPRMPEAEEGPMPFATSIGGMAVLTTGGVPYLRHYVAMEHRYEQFAPVMPHVDALLRSDPAARTSWERIVRPKPPGRALGAPLVRSTVELLGTTVDKVASAAASPRGTVPSDADS